MVLKCTVRTIHMHVIAKQKGCYLVLYVPPPRKVGWGLVWFKDPLSAPKLNPTMQASSSSPLNCHLSNGILNFCYEDLLCTLWSLQQKLLKKTKNTCTDQTEHSTKWQCNAAQDIHHRPTPFTEFKYKIK